jgi:hypothetical protein
MIGQASVAEGAGKGDVRVMFSTGGRAGMAFREVTG